MSPEEILIDTAGGTLACRVWGPEQAAPVLALHGWMDNAATFDALAPLLPDSRVIALDLPGHGLSSHRAAGAEYYIWSYVEDVLAVAAQLGLARFDLLGHSMGGAVVCLLAALYPDRIRRLALLDSVGPLATEPARAPEQMRRALRLKLGGESSPRRFPSREAAEAARADKGISAASARRLGARGIARDGGQWYWRSDRRLARPNLLSMSEAQVAAFLATIECPVLLVAARRFWEGERRTVFERRLACFRRLELLELDGNHYQHLEGPEVERVAERVRNFLA